MSAELTQIPDSLYNQFEAHDFQVMTWEELDPETFSISAEKEDLSKYLDEFIDQKIKFFAYLNFFSSNQQLSKIRLNYKPIYENTIKALIKEENLLVKFSSEAKLQAEEKLFMQKIEHADLKEYYNFFKLNFAYFDKIGNGYTLQIAGKFLTEAGIESGSKKTMKRIELWNPKDNSEKSVFRAFPLISKQGEEFLIQYVCFLDGYVRSSIDYYEASEIRRFYLPELKFNSQSSGSPEQNYKVKIFSNSSEAARRFLDTDQVAIHFNGANTIIERTLELSLVSSGKNFRGISIY